MNSADKPVRVTGEERPHPAVQKLSRAFLTLARIRLAEETAAKQVRPAKLADDELVKGGEPGGQHD
jgi:hypothetical protein